MITFGLDIGTTTISAVAVENGKLLSSLTRENDSALTDGPAWEKAQDPQRILSHVRSLLDELTEAYPQATRIGLTGQQHGIVYLDAQGDAVSPLYTWRDGRGDLPYREGTSYCQELTRRTGYPVATGYGMATHFYQTLCGGVPRDAVCLCTIQDYIAMKLIGASRPAVDPSDAASFGLYDAQRNAFDVAAVLDAGMRPELLPEVSATPYLGTDERGRQVYVAIGDNQASFLGATGGQTNCMLVNIGTGSQLSIHVDRYLRVDGLETRPFPTGGYLLVGAALCGGKAYALLERFFRETAEMVTGQPVESCYDAVTRMLDAYDEPADSVKITPLFCGTRANPSLRACIEGIGEENFHPLSLTYGMMRGMAQELWEMLQRYTSVNDAPMPLYGSGNGLRWNAHLRRVVEDVFGAPLMLSDCNEEAAFGAACFAAGQ